MRVTVPLASERLESFDAPERLEKDGLLLRRGRDGRLLAAAVLGEGCEAQTPIDEQCRANDPGKRAAVHHHHCEGRHGHDAVDKGDGKPLGKQSLHRRKRPEARDDVAEVSTLEPAQRQPQEVVKEVRCDLISDRRPRMKHQSTPHPGDRDGQQGQGAKTQYKHPEQQVVLLDERFVYDELDVER